MSKFLRAFLALGMMLVLTFALVACGDGGADNTDSAGADSAVTEGKSSYKVSVETKGGMTLSGVDVYVYADSSLSDLKQYGQTNEEGEVSFELAKGGDYAVVLSGLPKGYKVDSYYSFSGTMAQIALDSSVVPGESLAGAMLELGDVMYDFSVTTPYGETVTLSEMLKEKEVVVINFWYNGCSACQYEFPYMQEAYEVYSDDVGIIAIDPLFDSNSTKGYQESNGLTFTMASVPNSWTTAFNVGGASVDGYPTTVVVDRYGVICMVEEGALVSLRYWTSIFEHFTGDDYEQVLVNSADDLLTRVSPIYEMESSEEIGAVINGDGLQVTYRGEEEDEYSWPFLITEKNGVPCVKASNQEIEDSYAILYADVYLEAGQALCLDYLVSSEKGTDILYVIVDGVAIYNISGVSDPEVWQSCYPCVAEKSGTYEVALCYLKDESTNEGDDTVYIRNLRAVDMSEVDIPTYIVRTAASTEDYFEYDYVDIVYNEKDGYYHVGTANGPLLLVDMMNYTLFNEELTLWDIAYEGAASDYYEDLVSYFSYASNSSLNGVCTVTYELAELLKSVAAVAGFDSEDENEWLRMCKYYQAYGTNEQLTDPIKGLATFSAYEAKQGVNIPTNYFYYDRLIMPRGLLAEFTPTKSGVYRITSRTDTEEGTEAWIFNENREEIYVYEMSERLYNDDKNVSMVVYLEAGKTYYIDIAFWDYYEVGYIYYDIEYIGSSYNLFRLCSPGYFTYDTDATGSAMYHLIAGGIDVVLGEDGYYYEDLGLDENGKQKYGSVIYADFTGITSLFDTPVTTVGSGSNKVLGMIDKGAFDFSKDENDMIILGYMSMHDNDVEATNAYLRELWGDDFDFYAEEYKIEDVYEGIYHGEGEDLTEEMREFAKSMITSGKEELVGCVKVSARLAEILQLLMDKYTFKDVDNAWVKLCYYYQYLGPEA